MFRQAAHLESWVSELPTSLIKGAQRDCKAEDQTPRGPFWLFSQV